MWPPTLGQGELEPAGDVSKMCFVVFSFLLGLFSLVGTPLIAASPGHFRGWCTIVVTKARLAGSEAHTGHSVVEPFYFPPSRMPSLCFYFFFSHSFLCSGKQKVRVCGLKIYGRYYAHTWLSDLYWDRKGFFFKSVSGCKIS